MKNKFLKEIFILPFKNSLYKFKDKSNEVIFVYPEIESIFIITTEITENNLIQIKQELTVNEFEKLLKNNYIIKEKKQEYLLNKFVHIINNFIDKEIQVDKKFQKEINKKSINNIEEKTIKNFEEFDINKFIFL